MEKYILYGAGHDGVATLNYLGNDKVLCFCDTQKYGTFINGIPVICPEELKEKSTGATVVIAVSKNRFIVEICKYLASEGIDFVFWQDVVAEVIREQGREFSRICRRPSFKYDPQNEYIVTTDKYDTAGELESYFWQDLWAARLIYENKPQIHYDVGSRVDGFITHLLSLGQRVVQIDIRPLEVVVDGYGFVQADATNLDGIEDNSIKSLSALCSLEHFGLGRYGDDLDPEACFKTFNAVQRVLCRNGHAYISVPIGAEHMEFNAHRVFFAKTIIDSFSKMKLVEFSSCYRNQIEQNIDIHKYDNWMEWGGDRFGLFHFVKM